jgi:cytochrome b5
MSLATRLFTLDEIAEHRVPNSYWIIIHGLVYDVTTFADIHPGGRAALTRLAGKDASGPFDAVNHSGSAKGRMQEYLVGQVSDKDKADLAAQRNEGKKVLPQYRMSQVAEKRGPGVFWFVLNNMVLDVSSFGGDHPGGPEIIKYHSGTDATVAFKENGHSMQAVELSKKYIVGELVKEERVQHDVISTREWKAPPATVKPKENQETRFMIRQLVAILLFVSMVVLGWVAFLR